MERDSGAVARARWAIVAITAGLAAGAAAHRLVVLGRLEQTAALFIGLPAVMAIAVAMTGPARSATGMIMKVMTIGLLLSGILLGEGLICILMASPLFYLVGWIVGAAVDALRRRTSSRAASRTEGVKLSALLGLPFLLLSLEGVPGSLSFPRHEEVTAERVVAAAPDAVESALAQAPRFDAELPLFLRAGFPRPVSSTGAGLAVGDRRTVEFLGRKKGLRPRPLVMEVRERETEGDVQRVRFGAVSDATKIAQWLGWQEAEVEWAPLSDGRTRVRWTLRYVRRLDPAWYFGPWERLATSLAADYLIQTAAVPR